MTKKFLGLNGYQWTCILYVAVAIFTWQLKYFRHIDNNYLIFRDSWYHARAQVNLYVAYPKEYGDIYYYGPLFTLFVAPFAIPPEAAGFFLWQVANALAVILAVNMLPLYQKRKTAMLLLCAIEFANAIFYMQFNPMIAAVIIISFMLVEQGKERWATLLIVAGTLIKLYPVVGLAFFLFSKNKSKFIIWTLIWTPIMLVLPMLISSPSFVIQSYHQWLAALSDKSALNTGLNTSQDICVMGVVRRLTGNINIPNMPFLIAAAIIFVLPLLRFSQFKSYKFRLQILATSLIMVVIFSTGAEHPTFIIAVAGAVLWMMIQEKPFTAGNIILLVLLLVITGLGLTDAMPKPIRQDIIAKYSVKAWPCILIWLIISWELLFKNFVSEKGMEEERVVLVKS
ncbi:glycosyltransferase family 87 protein [Mucilaginibacter sp. McL0603]|uniref:glycosyltransferase family 87 protein n=1 Tax=Mucilaginibacter sp. McL0603 TaxID=3415670 RepID=UPI003CF98609